MPSKLNYYKRPKLMALSKQNPSQSTQWSFALFSTFKINTQETGT